MPQFDFSTLSLVLFNTLLSASLYYTFISLKLSPEVFTLLKFRTKKSSKKDRLAITNITVPNLFSYSKVTH